MRDERSTPHSATSLDHHLCAIRYLARAIRRMAMVGDDPDGALDQIVIEIECHVAEAESAQIELECRLKAAD